MTMAEILIMCPKITIEVHMGISSNICFIDNPTCFFGSGSLNLLEP
jgi:hypothetical protein